jgi:biopolymer transport protein ExbB
MIEFISQGGYGITAARSLRSASGPDPRLEARIDGVLFWGGFGVVLGIIGSLIGVVQAARIIEAAGGVVEPILIWGGIRVALTSTIVALLVFGLAALAWFALRRGYARRRARL